MREKFQRFMWGRYGNDRLNQFLMAAALVCLVISLFGLNIFYLLGFGLMIYAYFRMFSRKTVKRAAENQWFLRREMKVRGWLGSRKKAFAQRREYRIYKCPNCRQKLRVPRGKGRIAIRCRKCGTEFIRKS